MSNNNSENRTTDLIRFVIRCVADRAWGIAAADWTPAQVCRAIEDLSDDPAVSAAIEAEVAEYLSDRELQRHD